MKTLKSHTRQTGAVLAAAALLLAGTNAHADYQSTVLGDHPLAFYPINATEDPTGTTATDISGNGNDGTYNGTDPQYNTMPGPTPYIPNSLQFDGITSFVDLSTGTNTSILNFGGPISMEAWVQPANPGQSLGDILAKGYDGNNNYNEIALRLNGNQYQGETYNGSAGQQGTGGGTPSTNWAYVVATYDGTNWNMYVNAQHVGGPSADTVGALDWGAPWAIGSGTVSGSSRMFEGNITEVALYNYGLTASQVYNHYFAGEYGASPSQSLPIITSQPTPQVSFVGGGATFSVTVLSLLPTTNQWYKGNQPILGATNAVLVLTNLQSSDAVNYYVAVGNSNGVTNSTTASLTLSLPTPSTYESAVLNDRPLAYYPLDPTVDSTTNAFDWSGNGNNAVYFNQSPGFNDLPGPTPYITHAANFNGSSYGNMSLGANASILNFGGQITMEAWVQPGNTNLSLQDILAKGYDANQNYAEIAMREDDSTFNAIGQTGGLAQEGTWSYVVATYDGSSYNLYINGALVSSSPNGSGVADFIDPWCFGSGSASGANRLFNGNLSQVALYNHGLSANQVFTHYYAANYGSANPTNALPLISAQPISQSTYAGGGVQFNVSALSITALSYQWYAGSSQLAGQTNATLQILNAQNSNVGNYSVKITNANGSTNSATVALALLTPGSSLEWSANNNNGIWDTNTTANWIDLADQSTTVFTNGDSTLFDDTTGVPTTVTLNNTVEPSLITVNSTNNNFVLQRNSSGAGAIGGAGSLIKEGPSILNITTAGGFTGSASILGGIIYAGNTCLGGVSQIIVTNGASLDLGGGSLQGHKPVTVSGVGFNGTGAISNSYDDYPSESFDITMTGDTKFGGANRWDLSSGSSVRGPHTLTMDWSSDADNHYAQWNVVTVGADVVGIDVTNAPSGISITNTLGVIGMDSAFENPSTVVTFNTNCVLMFYGGGFNGSLHLLSGSLVNHGTAPAGFYGSTITMEDNAQFTSSGNGGASAPIDSAIIFNGIAHFKLSGHENIYSNVLSGAGGFLLDSQNNEMLLEASNTYSGPTIIGSSGNSPEVALAGNGSISHSSLIFFGGSDPTIGHIDATGRTDDTLTLANGQTLAGVGGVAGNLVVTANAILSPGGTNMTLGITTGSNPVGTLAASGNVTLGGTTDIKLNGSTNDMVTAGGNLTYGNTLNLVNISGTPLVGGQSFQIFNAATYSGNFTQINPTTPGNGLTWDTTHLSSGIIRVISGTVPPLITSTKLQGGNLIFSGTGGSPNGTYYVLSSTNLLTPLANWTVVSTNAFDNSGGFSVTNAVSAGVPQLFYLIK